MRPSRSQTTQLLVFAPGGSVPLFPPRSVPVEPCAFVVGFGVCVRRGVVGVEDRHGNVRETTETTCRCFFRSHFRAWVLVPPQGAAAVPVWEELRVCMYVFKLGCWCRCRCRCWVRLRCWWRVAAVCPCGLVLVPLQGAAQGCWCGMSLALCALKPRCWQGGHNLFLLLGLCWCNLVWCVRSKVVQFLKSTGAQPQSPFNSTG